MGNKHSTFPDTVGIHSRESGASSPDCFMIEPVPEGLEHVVYPKYEEAFRLGLEAFSNPVRVNKFKRPLPHILGTLEFQQQPHAGIVPTSENSCSSGMPSARNSSFKGVQAPVVVNEPVQEYLNGANNESGGGMFVLNAEERVTRDDEAEIEVHDFASPFSTSESDVLSITSPLRNSDNMDLEMTSDDSQRVLDPSSSLSQLDGGLFESDLAVANALEVYRKSEESPRGVQDKTYVSIRFQNQNSDKSERSRMAQELLQFSKNLSDLQSQRVTQN